MRLSDKDPGEKDAIRLAIDLMKFVMEESSSIPEESIRALRTHTAQEKIIQMNGLLEEVEALNSAAPIDSIHPPADESLVRDLMNLLTQYQGSSSILVQIREEKQIRELDPEALRSILEMNPRNRLTFLVPANAKADSLERFRRYKNFALVQTAETSEDALKNLVKEESRRVGEGQVAVIASRKILAARAFSDFRRAVKMADDFVLDSGELKTISSSIIDESSLIPVAMSIIANRMKLSGPLRDSIRFESGVFYVDSALLNLSDSLKAMLVEYASHLRTTAAA